MVVKHGHSITNALPVVQQEMECILLGITLWDKNQYLGMTAYWSWWHHTNMWCYRCNERPYSLGCFCYRISNALMALGRLCHSVHYIYRDLCGAHKSKNFQGNLRGSFNQFWSWSAHLCPFSHCVALCFAARLSSQILKTFLITAQHAAISGKDLCHKSVCVHIKFLHATLHLVHVW